MKTFKYSALTRDGDPTNGIIEANNKDEAMAQLKGDGLVITAFEETGKSIDINLALGGRKTQEKVLALICNQFSIILGSGIPIVRAVELVAAQTADKAMKKVLEEVVGDIAAGYSLADSFATHGKYLPNTFIETVRAGEESGNLETVFKRLHDYFDKRSKTKSKVISSMIYPAFVVAVAVIVVIIIMVFAVPMFTSTFEQLGTELPLITKMMIGTSNFFKKYILLIIVVIAAIVIALKFWSKAPRGEDFFGKLALKIPIFGRVNRMSGASQYASTMSIMLSAGLSVIKSIDVTGRSMNNFIMRRALLGTIPDLEAGKRLGLCIAKTEVFPELLVEMTAVGEETGSLESTLNVIGEYYDNEVEVATARALSVLEPAIIIFLAVFVVGVLLSVYLPLFSMYGSV